MNFSSFLGGSVFRTVIPRNVRLAEAPSFGKPALYHDNHSRGALAYLALRARSIGARQPLNGLEPRISAGLRYNHAVALLSLATGSRWLKGRSLGRGLEALLSTDTGSTGPVPQDTLRDIPIDLLEGGPFQPRADMREGSLAELAASIRLRPGPTDRCSAPLGVPIPRG
ncbi:MAG: hypothetical protein CM1200mP36_09890 [Gammaproteobacteria bacterium]|nr:MAG: hypothetical protein CM1200mP36_09890 [Gammaproteobacteria bacterium]